LKLAEVSFKEWVVINGLGLGSREGVQLKTPNVAGIDLSETTQSVTVTAKNGEQTVIPWSHCRYAFPVAAPKADTKK
jgi:hypothetical protein